MRLKHRQPDLARAVVKLSRGFSGEGNAVFSFDGAPTGAGLEAWVLERLPRLAFEGHAACMAALRGQAGL
ncbi:MAG: hypothetical protein R3E48_22720 [Burkholderiaceae bacterium]